MDDLSFNPDLITPETQNKFFRDLPLNSTLVSLYESFNFLHPTPIQFRSIPPGVESKNIIAQSKAGTGKTLAYTSIILNNLLHSTQKCPATVKKTIKYLVLSPTRELAIQIHKFLNKFFVKGQPLLKTEYKAGLCIGGLPVQDIRNSLKLKQYDMIVGTLGRIIELIKEKSLDLSNLEIIVLDEADKMFNPENLNNTSQILRIIRKTTQILAYSGTFTPKNLLKMKEFMPESEEIFLLPSIKRKAENQLEESDLEKEKDLNLISISQILFEIPGTEKIYPQKTAILVKLLKSVKFSQCLIFYNEKHRGEELATDLKEEGFSVTFIHGDQTQSDRIKVMNRLCLSKVNILVATDLLSRGIDIMDIDFVINYDIPKKIETYFHRIGRTGRYGKKGVSVVLVSGEEKWFLEKNQKNLKNLQKNSTIEEIISNANEFLKKTEKEEENNQKSKKRRMEGFFLDNCNTELKWIEKKEKNPNEEAFKYFDEDHSKETKLDQNIGKIKQEFNFDGFKCLECSVCKEFLEKTQVLMKKKFEILKYFKV